MSKPAALVAKLPVARRPVPSPERVLMLATAAVLFPYSAAMSPVNNSTVSTTFGSTALANAPVSWSEMGMPSITNVIWLCDPRGCTAPLAFCANPGKLASTDSSPRRPATSAMRSMLSWFICACEPVSSGSTSAFSRPPSTVTLDRNCSSVSFTVIRTGTFERSDSDSVCGRKPVFSTFSS